MAGKLTIDLGLQDKLVNALKNIRVDYAEIRAETSSSTRILYRGPDPEVIAQPDSIGFFVRVLVNGSWGITTFTDIKNLKQKVSEAVSFAHLQGKGTVVLAPNPQTVAQITPVINKDFREISLKTKVNLVKGYNGILLKGDKSVQSTTTSYNDSYLTKFFVNSLGTRIYQERPYVRLSSTVIARDREVLEMYRDSRGHVGGYEVVEGLDKRMEEIAKEAGEIVKSPKVKSGIYTVIIDPFMAGTFAHEAFGHFSEADHQYENPKILEQMEIGRKLGSDKVTIVDDPSLFEGWGNYIYDDEGVVAKKVNLLTAGFITGRLHSLETAGKLGEQPNGHARADGYRSKPLVRMSNTYFEGGKDKFKDMVSSTKKGLLVVSWYAGMTAMENFTFTGMYGVMIENGKLTQKVRGVKLTGNVFETLKNIDAVSDDFKYDQGTCGKGGQEMPVGSGGGYVRINNLTVGGE